MNLRDRAMSWMLSSGGSAKYEDDRNPRDLLFALVSTLMDNDWRIPELANAQVHGESSKQCNCAELSKDGVESRRVHYNACAYVRWCDRNGVTRPETYTEGRT